MMDRVCNQETDQDKDTNQDGSDFQSMICGLGSLTNSDVNKTLNGKNKKEEQESEVLGYGDENNAPEACEPTAIPPVVERPLVPMTDFDVTASDDDLTEEDYLEDVTKGRRATLMKVRTNIRGGPSNPSVDANSNDVDLRGLFSSLSFQKVQTSKSTSDLWTAVRNDFAKLSEYNIIKEYFETEMGEFDGTFLHVVCMNNPPEDVVSTIVNTSPQLTALKNNLGMLPLHVAAGFRASVEVLRVLIAAYPNAIQSRDDLGRVPLHYSFSCIRNMSSINSKSESNIRGSNLCPVCVAILTSPAVVMMKDNKGRVPLCYFGIFCGNISPSNVDERERARIILRQSIDSISKTSNIHASALSYLPSWLLKEALLCSPVQHHINEWVCSQSFTAVFMLDLSTTILLLVAFIYAVSRITDKQERVLTWEIVLYGCNSYLLSRHVFSMLGSIKMRKFKLWIEDPWNWIEGLNICFVFTSTILMERREDFYRTFVMIAGGWQWISVTSILRIVHLNFSVFVSGTIRIIRSLAPFLIATFLLLSSFSFMYHVASYDSPTCVANTGSQKDGVWNDIDVTSCTWVGSLLNTYTMLVSGGLGTNYFTEDYTIMILSVIFGILIMILQLNLLIAIVNDNYAQAVANGSELFWLHRFQYMINLDTTAQLFISNDSSYSFFGWIERKSHDQRKCWDRALWNLTSKKRENDGLVMDILKQNSLSFRRLLILIGLFFWLLAGLLTFGLLWPPQVKKLLFCPIVIEKGDDDDELNHDMVASLSTMKSEMKDLKVELNSKVDTIHELISELLASQRVVKNESSS
mmetsp:Transcript_14648/g.21646  ORF Transcript_14648/g.21646 Transcript_14648/m.21646 type:complete len:805 (-) Transcript_14648:120-2534(-)